MPELPEVETTVRAFRPRLEGRRIVRFVSRVAKQANPSVAAVRRGIVGKRIIRLRRRAKYIVVDLGDERGEGPEDAPGRGSKARRRRKQRGQRQRGHLLIHLGMSGRFEWAAEGNRPQHVRAILELDDGHRMLFCDARKFGKIIYATDFKAATEHLGVEPLGRGFTAVRFERLLRGRARQLKPLLLDQSIVAGLGNIYADETLFRARLHPATRSDRLTSREIERLRRAIQTVLLKAIRLRGTSFDQVYRGGQMWERLTVYGRAGLPCRRCRTPIEALRIAQRGTHICPKCQPLDGRP